MSLFLGNNSRVREITPPRQFEVLTGRTYLNALESGDLRTYRERATFTLDEASGQVSINSEYGDFSYRWTSIGSQSLAAFLCSLDIDYFMNKAASAAWQEIDFDATIAGIKAQIIETRLERGALSKESARAAWDEIEGIDEDAAKSVDLFYAAFNQCSEIQGIIDIYDLHVCERIKPSAQRFWDIVMPPFRAHIEKLGELEKSNLDLAAA